jgi:tRNA A37 methylthiotransferase MiaB
MKRGYTREAYLDLIERIRDIIPGVTFTSDFICGFCSESEEAHQDTLDLLERVKYNYVYMFPYSMREKTHAYHDLKDDVPLDVKKRRVNEVVEIFRRNALELNRKRIGTQQLILVEGRSKRSPSEFVGRTDANVKVVFPHIQVPQKGVGEYTHLTLINPGDYVVVQVEDCSSQTLKGNPLYVTTLSHYHENEGSHHQIADSIN